MRFLGGAGAIAPGWWRRLLEAVVGVMAVERERDANHCTRVSPGIDPEPSEPLALRVRDLGVFGVDSVYIPVTGLGEKVTGVSR